jgi:hypothetical protein
MSDTGNTDALSGLSGDKERDSKSNKTNRAGKTQDKGRNSESKMTKATGSKRKATPTKSKATPTKLAKTSKNETDKAGAKTSKNETDKNEATPTPTKTNDIRKARHFTVIKQFEGAIEVEKKKAESALKAKDKEINMEAQAYNLINTWTNAIWEATTNGYKGDDALEHALDTLKDDAWFFFKKTGQLRGSFLNAATIHHSYAFLEAKDKQLKADRVGNTAN